MSYSASRFTRFVALLVLIVIVMQLYSLSLLYKLERGGDSIASNWLAFSSLPTDKTGNYYIKAHFAERTNRLDAPEVSLVTQCSPNHLHNLAHLAERWEGPISVAVFITADHMDAAHELIIDFRECFTKLKSFATFHTVYPSNSLSPAGGFTYPPNRRHRLQCRELLQQAKTMSGINYGLVNIPYPNNLLRNVARLNSRTGHVLVIDADMLPNRNLHQQIIKLGLSQLSERTVYVLPAFELIDDETVPATKSELSELVKRQRARPFYMERCWKCHKHTDYDRWFSLVNRNPNDLHPAYEVYWKDAYEPFYLSSNEVPLYDERFKQYGFNRISQVCELHVAGYAFVVFDEAFVVHRGFKVKERFHASKDAENARNKVLFQTMRRELKSKYPKSARTCN